MYLNYTFAISTINSLSLTLTWDVFKWNFISFWVSHFFGLTLTWDVFKSMNKFTKIIIGIV